MDYSALPVLPMSLFDTPKSPAYLWLQNVGKDCFYVEHQTYSKTKGYYTRACYGGIKKNEELTISQLHVCAEPEQRVMCYDSRDHIKNDRVETFVISEHPIKRIPANEPLPYGDDPEIWNANTGEFTGNVESIGCALDRRGVIDAYFVVEVTDAIPGTSGGEFKLVHSDNGADWELVPEGGFENRSIKIGGRYVYTGYRTFARVNPAGVKRFVAPMYKPSIYIGGIAFRFRAATKFLYQRRAI